MANFLNINDDSLRNLIEILNPVNQERKYYKDSWINAVGGCELYTNANPNIVFLAFIITIQNNEAALRLLRFYENDFVTIIKAFNYNVANSADNTVYGLTYKNFLMFPFYKMDVSVAPIVASSRFNANYLKLTL